MALFDEIVKDNRKRFHNADFLIEMILYLLDHPITQQSLDQPKKSAYIYVCFQVIAFKNILDSFPIHYAEQALPHNLRTSIYVYKCLWMSYLMITKHDARNICNEQ